MGNVFKAELADEVEHVVLVSSECKADDGEAFPVLSLERCDRRRAASAIASEW